MGQGATPALATHPTPHFYCPGLQALPRFRKASGGPGPHGSPCHLFIPTWAKPPTREERSSDQETSAESFKKCK